MQQVSSVSSLASTPSQAGIKPAVARDEVPFQLFLDQAARQLSQPNGRDAQSLKRGEFVAQAINQDELDRLDQRRREDKEQIRVSPVQSNANLQTNRLEVTPFQLFIDKAVDSLENVSQMEFRVNDLIEQYIQGKVSIDEVAIETNKLNLAITFMTTVVSSATQTFKELTQMSI